MRVVDLFAGAGLLSYAFRTRGFDISRAIECDPRAADTYPSQPRRPRDLRGRPKARTRAPGEALRRRRGVARFRLFFLRWRQDGSRPGAMHRFAPAVRPELREDAAHAVAHAVERQLQALGDLLVRLPLQTRASTSISRSLSVTSGSVRAPASSRSASRNPAVAAATAASVLPHESWPNGQDSCVFGSGQDSCVFRSAPVLVSGAGRRCGHRGPISSCVRGLALHHDRDPRAGPADPDGIVAPAG